MAVQNKKVLNATSVKLGNIQFKSKLEERVYKRLVGLGYRPKYELKPIIIWDGFRPTKKHYEDGVAELTKKGELYRLQDWKYTPDFVLELNGYTFYIEAKGNPNDLWPYKKKLFLKWLESQDKAFFFQVRTINGLLKSLNIMEEISNDRK